MIFKKKEEVPLRDVPKRVQNMTREELILWGDTTLMQTGSAFDSWRFRSGSIEDVSLAAETFAAIVVELNKRTNT